MLKRSNNSTEQWLSVSYQPVSLFTLKRSDATSMAARSTLVPTPCAIKMALLKALLEAEGIQHIGKFDLWINQEFEWIRDLQIRVIPPKRLVVNRNGYKLRYWNQQSDKDYRKANSRTAPPTLPMQDGFVFREWVHLQGKLHIECQVGDRVNKLVWLFSQIHYFGKRGCFFQYLPDETHQSDAPRFDLTPATGLTIQPMDDFGNEATFQRINPYSDEKIRVGCDRLLCVDFLPLKLTISSAHYDLYTRTLD